MSSSTDVWETPEVKEFLEKEREDKGAVIDNAEGFCNCTTEHWKRAIDRGEAEAETLLYVSFLVIAGSECIEEAIARIEQLDSSPDSRHVSSSADMGTNTDSNYALDTQQEFMRNVCVSVQHFLSSLKERSLSEADTLGNREQFNSAVVTAKFFIQCYYIRIHISAAKRNHESFTSEKISALKRESKPFKDALASTMKHKDANLGSALRKLRDKLPCLREVELKANMTVYGIFETLQKAWEKELKKDNSPA